MSDHPYVPLPAQTTLGKSFEYGLDVNLGSYAVPSWQPIRRISGWAPTYPSVTADISSYDDRGAPSNEVTARGFATTFTVQGNRSLISGLYLPELEALFAAAKGIGNAAVLDIRWYHKPDEGTPNPTDAGRALVTVEATRANTGNAEVEVWSVTLTGRGRYQPIANPFAGWDVTEPAIAGITTSSGLPAGDGDLITITGTGLLGATGVTIGGDPSPEVLPVNASTLIAVMPAGDAGPVNVTVTTVGGTSPAFAYTRGA